MSGYPYTNVQNEKLLRNWKPSAATSGLAQLLGINVAEQEKKFREWAISATKTYMTLADLDVAYIGQLYQVAQKQQPAQMTFTRSPYTPDGEDPRIAETLERNRQAQAERERLKAEGRLGAALGQVAEIRRQLAKMKGLRTA